jgi:hypothetical protein
VRRVVLLAMFTGCVEASSVPPGESHSIKFDWPARGAPQLDLLFVVDDTQTMTPYRDKIRELGPLTAWALRHYTAGMPDVHIAVAATSSPELVMISDLHNNDGSRKTSYSGELGDVIADMLDVGASSTYAPQPLATIERTLSETVFVRPDTHFMVVTITGEDDHSLESVSHYVDTVKAHRRWASATGVFPANASRLDAFHRAFDPWDRGLQVPLDSPDWSRTMSPITDIIIDFWYPCFYDPLPQPYECSISMIENDRETVLPPCAITPSGACWEMVVDPICVSDQGAGTTIDVRGYARPYRPHLVGECVSQ